MIEFGQFKAWYNTGRFPKSAGWDWDDKLDDSAPGISISECPLWFWDCIDKSEIEQLMEDYCSEDTKTHLVQLLNLLHFPQVETEKCDFYTIEEVTKAQEEESKLLTVAEALEEEEAEDDQQGEELNLSLYAEFELESSSKPKEKKMIAFAPKDLAEQRMSNRLAAMLGGIREVPTLAGRIDVITDNHVIEVKNAAAWKHGIGQVIVYNFYYPEKKPALFLFGGNVKTYRAIAKQHCDRLGILYREAPTHLTLESWA